MDGSETQNPDEAWERQAKNLVRGELMKRGMSHQQLVHELALLGVTETVPNLRNKLSRGRFTIVWFLQIMAAIGVERLLLPQPPGTPSGDEAASDGGAHVLARGANYRPRKKAAPPAGHSDDSIN